MQITVMTARRVTLLVPIARRSTLLLVSPDVLSLATPASRKREVEHGDGQAEGQAESGPGLGEQQCDQDRRDADDERGDDGAAQHLGQRVAPEAREAVEHVHGRAPTGTCGSA